jgi:hypothetical protein
MSYCALDPIEKWLSQYFILPNNHCMTAILLWLAHTRLMEEAAVTPRLLLLSPEPSSGKTTLLQALSFLCSPEPHGRTRGSVSAAVLARSARKDKDGNATVETWGADLPPMFIDEVDKKYRSKDTEDVRTTEILNAGFAPGQVYERMGGKNNTQIETYPIFGAVALSGINTAAIPRALETRCIVIPMDKATPEERKQLTKFRRRDVLCEYKPLREALDEFARGISGKIRPERVSFPAGMEARDEDMWEILLAIANVIGWTERAETAAAWFSSERAEATEESAGILLLTEAAEILKDHKGKLSSDELRRELFNREGSPWNDQGLTTSRMKAALKRYGIKPKTIRLGAKTDKGYHIDQFEDVLLRHRCGLFGENGNTGNIGHIIDNKNKDVTEVTNVTDVAENVVPIRSTEDKLHETESDDWYDREERAATLQYDGGFSRQKAEALAADEFPELPSFLDRRRHS